MAIDVVLQLMLGLAPVARDVVQSYRGKRGPGVKGPLGAGAAPAALAPVVPVGSGPVPPLPAEWARWFGARPEPRGAPENTLLAVPGLYTMSPAFRAGLLDLCAELAVPVDAMVAIIASESGFKPAALNPLPAAGLIQLTVGARLPGFDSADKIREVTQWSPERQLAEIIGPYYRRFGAKVAGASPGRLYMLNFLPAHADKDEAFVLGVLHADQAPEAANAAPKDLAQLRFSAAVYRENSGFDRAKKGSITVGDVYASIAKTCAVSKGRRIAVDGTLLDPPQTSAPAGKTVVDAGPPDPAAPAPSTAPVAPADVVAALRTGIVTAWPDRVDPIRWVPLRLGEYALEVSAEPLSVQGVRIPLTFRDALMLCHGSGYVPPTIAICDARWAQATRRIVLEPPGLPGRGQAWAPTQNPDAWEQAQALEWNRRIGPLGAELADGAWKEWVLDTDMGAKKAVNYGLRRANGTLWQTAGRQHNGLYRDYSQLQTLVKRAAQRAGQTVDLLDELAGGGPLGGPLPAWLVEALR